MQSNQTKRLKEIILEQVNSECNMVNKTLPAWLDMLCQSVICDCKQEMLIKSFGLKPDTEFFND